MRKPERLAASAGVMAILFAIAFLNGCSKPPRASNGFPDWNDAQASAEAFVLHGDGNAILDHANMNGVPSAKVKQIKSVLADWRGVSDLSMTCSSTQVMTFTEFRTLEQNEKKDLPEDMQNALLSGIQWNVEPEKMIVFTFVSKYPHDKANAKYSVGAYRTNNLWWFATSYSK